MEAFPTSHHWARALTKRGHDVRLMPANQVKAYVKCGKIDANDGAAICEAVTKPDMRFVAIKTKEQHAALMLHRSHQLLIRQRTVLSNAARGHLAELEIVAPMGRKVLGGDGLR
ncbi:MAG: IS110 family transposase [Hyphomicrobiaceae bacterium]